MLLKVGIIMMSLAAVLAIGVAAVGLQDDGPDNPALSEPRPPETTAETPPVPDDEPEREPAPRESLPVAEQDWPAPEGDEVAAANGPRYYEPAPGTVMTLTVEALGLYDVPILSSDSTEALDAGAVHVPGTSFPWDGGAQRNVYLAGHRLGYEGTGSRLLFYNLDKLGRGDEVVLEGRGQVYRYRVSDLFVVGPDARWVMGQVRDRDMVTLQTCTPIPTFENRLIVRADRV